MLSRVADSVYWLSRYIERAENVARFIDVNFNLTLGEGETLGGQWASLIYTTGGQDAYEKLYGQPTREGVLQFLLFDDRNPNSIMSCVAAARENARTIREVISSVVWEELNTFFLMVKSASELGDTIDQPQSFCRRVRLASHLLVGAADATMSQGESWHFSRVGRFLERSDKTSRIVDVQYFILLPDPEQVGTALDVVRWSALLKSASALEMYRRQHGKIVPKRVADFLILDRYFPRSMHFCLVKAQESMRAITGSLLGTFRNASEQSLGRLCANLDYATIEDIIQRGMHEYIDDFQQKINLVGSAIRDDFFSSHTERQVERQSQNQA